jgi:imidazolonepropionase-like amidohydrolase
VIAHFQTTVSPQEALQKGVDLIAHMQEYYFDFFDRVIDEDGIQAAVDMTLANRASVTSTLVIDELTAQVAGNNQQGIDDYWSRPELRWFPQASIDLTNQKIFTLKAVGEEPGDFDDDLEFMRRLTRDLHDAGVPILMGTDAPGTGSVPGFSVHREIQALLACGISLPDVLRIATWNTANFIIDSLNLNTPFGAIRRNWRADLVLLESNPLQSAENIKDTAGVMAGGRWRSAAFMDQ